MTLIITLQSEKGQVLVTEHVDRMAFDICPSSVLSHSLTALADGPYFHNFIVLYISVLKVHRIKEDDIPS